MIIISEKVINQIYQTNHFTFIYKDRIYKTANSVKNKIKYINANGKTGVEDIIGENALL